MNKKASAFFFGGYMGLKEDYQNYKQRQEAKRYFRSNNDAFMTLPQTILMACSTLAVATIVKIGWNLLFSMISIQFSIEYIIIAYFVTMTIRHFTSTPRITTTLIGIITYIFGIILGKVIYLAIIYRSVAVLFHTNILLLLLSQGLFSTIFMLFGVFYIYYYTK